MHGCNFSMDSALWLMEGRPRSTVNFELSVWLFFCATDPEAGGAERELLQCDVCGMLGFLACMGEVLGVGAGALARIGPEISGTMPGLRRTVCRSEWDDVLASHESRLRPADAVTGRGVAFDMDVRSERFFRVEYAVVK